LVEPVAFGIIQGLEFGTRTLPLKKCAAWFVSERVDKLHQSQFEIALFRENSVLRNARPHPGPLPQGEGEPAFAARNTFHLIVAIPISKSAISNWKWYQASTV
jgi:hypothetical protein